MFAASLRAGIMTVTRGAGSGRGGALKSTVIRRRPSNIDRMMNPKSSGPRRTYNPQAMTSSHQPMRARSYEQPVDNQRPPWREQQTHRRWDGGILSREQ